MTTIRQLIQTSPVKAKDLFAKLADISETATKTRERLFFELKAELELQAELQEKHLFPVLEKHKETKDLVAEALDDNRETRKLMAELEKIPRDSKEFGTKVVEVRKVFQQHVRDEKKEFLPAVAKALSEEEASAVVEKIEDKHAEIEAAQRAEAKERRADAKQERKQAEDASDQDADSVAAGAVAVQQGAKAAQSIVKSGATQAREKSLVATQETDGETALVGRSMADLFSEQTQHAMKTTFAIGHARTLADVTKAQSDFIGGSFQRMEQFNERYLVFMRGWMASVSRTRPNL